MSRASHVRYYRSYEKKGFTSRKKRRLHYQLMCLVQCDRRLTWEEYRTLAMLRHKLKISTLNRPMSKRECKARKEFLLREFPHLFTRDA